MAVQQLGRQNHNVLIVVCFQVLPMILMFYCSHAPQVREGVPESQITQAILTPQVSSHPQV
jgi:hypothetical protein